MMPKMMAHMMSHSPETMARVYELIEERTSKGIRMGIYRERNVPAPVIKVVDMELFPCPKSNGQLRHPVLASLTPVPQTSHEGHIFEPFRAINSYYDDALHGIFKPMLDILLRELTILIRPTYEDARFWLYRIDEAMSRPDLVLRWLSDGEVIDDDQTFVERWYELPRPFPSEPIIELSRVVMG